MSKEFKTAGKHFLADVWYKGHQPNYDALVELLTRECKLHIADKLIKYFEPYGETRLYLLTESHLTIHTYPEHNYFSLDIYTCGDEGRPERAEEVLKKLNLRNIKIKRIPRGL